MKSLNRIRSALVIIPSMVFLFSCTKPPPPGGAGNSGDVDSLFSTLYTVQNPVHMQCQGDMLFSLDGERFNCAIDMDWKRSGAFKADLFTAFGQTIASILADSMAGKIKTPTLNMSFDLDQTMDSLPLTSARELTFREFSRYLTGRMPQYRFLSGKPDSVLRDHDRISLIWNRDSVIVKAFIKGDPARIDRVVYQRPNGGELSFGAFKQGIAREIAFKEDDKNYFSVRYKNITLN